MPQSLYLFPLFQSLFLAEKVFKLQDPPKPSRRIKLALQTTRTKFVSHQTHIKQVSFLGLHEGHCIKIQQQHIRTNTRVVSYQTQ